MQFLEAWSTLSPGSLLAWLALPGAVLVAAFMPGRRFAGFAAAIAAAAVLAGSGLRPWWLTTAWSALFAVLAAMLVRGAEAQGPRRRPRSGLGFEAGVIALPLGVALLGGLVAVVSRLVGEPLLARRATLGVLLVGAGVLHLMLRRNAQRAPLAFAALGMGLELLFAAARAMDALAEGPPAGVALAVTAFAVAIVHRVADARGRYAGSPFVSDAHQLQD